MAKERARLPKMRRRERVLQLVRGHDGPVDAVQLAAQLGVHVTTMRFHLDALCDEGMVIRTPLNRSGPGRPRTGYLPVEGRLDYRAFADVLVAELGDTVDTRARRAERAGARLAGRIANSGNPRASGAAGGDALDRTASLTHEVFDRMGFAPEFAGADGPSTSSSRVIRLRDCPIRDLARAHPEVGCGVHRGLLQGLAGSSAVAVEDADAHAARLSARLEPFVEPELCLVTLAADDQAGA